VRLETVDDFADAETGGPTRRPPAASLGFAIIGAEPVQRFARRPEVA
jgi:hypothetical protein